MRQVADGLFVVSGNRNYVTFTDCNFQTWRWFDFDRMGVAECHDQLLTVHLCTITDADYFQGAGETFGYTFDHICYEGAAQPVETAHHAVV